MTIATMARGALFPIREARSWTRAELPRAGPRVLRFSFELLLVLPAYLAYHLVRGAVEGRADQAFANARALIQAERTLGIFWEVTLQELILGHHLLISAFNGVYIYGHMPLIALLAIWILLFRPEAFARYRNAFLLSGAIGLIFFVTLPMAPPRMIEGAGFVDTITLHSNAYRVLQPPAFVNQYAAMPSLHFGWNLLVGLALFQTTCMWYVRSFALLLPAAMLAGIVLTGNHYILDAAVGGAIAIVALWLATAANRRLRGTRIPAFLY